MSKKDWSGSFSNGGGGGSTVVNGEGGEQTGMSCDEPTHVTSCDPKPTVEECCTGGATETTAKCANISKSWTTGSLGTFDRCTYSFGGIDLPDDNYTYADFEALILGVGGTIEPNPNNADQYTICVPDGFRTCYDRACFNGNIGQLTRACVVALPNTTEPECKEFQRTWGKYEEPTANILQTQLDVLEDVLEKMCEDAGACVSEPLLGNWCDITFAAEPEQEDVINASNILIFVETCGATQTLQYFTAGENGELVPYEPVADVVDCDSYEEPQPEPPTCPDGAVFEQVCIPPNSYGILDNSNWAPGPGNHLQNGSAYEVTLTHEDGTTTVLPVLADPYYRGFRSALEATLPNCKVVYVCANHTSPRGCNAGHVANLASYPAYDAPTFPGDIQNNLANPDQSELWASGWLIDCAGCESPIVRAEITGSSNPDWIGAAKDIINYKGDEQILFRAITCDGVFWKDCNGNDVAAPVGGCCAKPCNASVLDDILDKLCQILGEPADGCGCAECPKIDAGITTDTDTNDALSFPLTVTGGFINHTTPITISDPTGCLAANPDALISVKYEVDHEAGPYPIHRLYVLSASAGTFTSQSVSNSQGVLGTASIQIGYGATDPVANQRNTRWVKLTATADEWLAGISVSALGFGGVGGSTETIHSQSIEVCEGIGEICDGC